MKLLPDRLIIFTTNFADPIVNRQIILTTDFTDGCHVDYFTYRF